MVKRESLIIHHGHVRSQQQAVKRPYQNDTVSSAIGVRVNGVCFYLACDVENERKSNKLASGNFSTCLEVMMIRTTNKQ